MDDAWEIQDGDTAIREEVFLEEMEVEATVGLTINQNNCTEAIEKCVVAEHEVSQSPSVEFHPKEVIEQAKTTSEVQPAYSRQFSMDLLASQSQQCCDIDDFNVGSNHFSPSPIPSEAGSHIGSIDKTVDTSASTANDGQAAAPNIAIAAQTENTVAVETLNGSEGNISSSQKSASNQPGLNPVLKFSKMCSTNMTSPPGLSSVDEALSFLLKVPSTHSSSLSKSLGKSRKRSWETDSQDLTHSPKRSQQKKLIVDKLIQSSSQSVQGFENCDSTMHEIQKYSHSEPKLDETAVLENKYKACRNEPAKSDTENSTIDGAVDHSTDGTEIFSQISPHSLKALCRAVDQSNLDPDSTVDPASCTVEDSVSDLAQDKCSAQDQPQDEAESPETTEQNNEEDLLFSQISPTAMDAIMRATDSPTTAETLHGNQKLPVEAIGETLINWKSAPNITVGGSLSTLSLPQNKLNFVTPNKMTCSTKLPLLDSKTQRNVLGDQVAKRPLSLKTSRTKKFFYPSSNQIAAVCPQRVFNFEAEKKFVPVSGKANDKIEGENRAQDSKVVLVDRPVSSCATDDQMNETVQCSAVNLQKPESAGVLNRNRAHTSFGHLESASDVGSKDTTYSSHAYGSAVDSYPVKVTRKPYWRRYTDLEKKVGQTPCSKSSGHGQEGGQFIVTPHNEVCDLNRKVGQVSVSSQQKINDLDTKLSQTTRSLRANVGDFDQKEGQTIVTSYNKVSDLVQKADHDVKALMTADYSIDQGTAAGNVGNHRTSLQAEIQPSSTASVQDGKSDTNTVNPAMISGSKQSTMKKVSAKLATSTPECITERCDETDAAAAVSKPSGDAEVSVQISTAVFGGFQSASGKSIALKEENLRKAMGLMQDVEKQMDGEKPYLDMNLQSSSLSNVVGENYCDNRATGLVTRKSVNASYPVVEGSKDSNLESSLFSGGFQNADRKSVILRTDLIRKCSGRLSTVSGTKDWLMQECGKVTNREENPPELKNNSGPLEATFSSTAMENGSSAITKSDLRNLRNVPKGFRPFKPPQISKKSIDGGDRIALKKKGPNPESCTWSTEMLKRVSKVGSSSAEEKKADDCVSTTVLAPCDGCASATVEPLEEARAVTETAHESVNATMVPLEVVSTTLVPLGECAVTSVAPPTACFDDSLDELTHTQLTKLTYVAKAEPDNRTTDAMLNEHSTNTELPQIRKQHDEVSTVQMSMKTTVSNDGCLMGFQTAGGKDVSVSDQAIHNARSMLAEMELPSLISGKDLDRQAEPKPVIDKMDLGNSHSYQKKVQYVKREGERDKFSTQTLRTAQDELESEDCWDASQIQNSFNSPIMEHMGSDMSMEDNTDPGRSEIPGKGSENISTVPNDEKMNSSSTETFSVLPPEVRGTTERFHEKDTPSAVATIPQEGRLITGFGGFSTAGGKMVSVSKESLKHARSLLENGEADFKESEKRTAETQTAAFHCFQTAGGKKVEVSEASLSQVKKFSVEESVSVKQEGNYVKTKDSVWVKKKPGFCEFHTASKSKVGVSETALATMKSLLEEAKGGDAAGSVSAEPPATVFGGFQTAAGRKVVVSDEALAQARGRLQDTVAMATDKEHKPESAEQDTVEAIPNFKFRTARGQNVSISQGDLHHARSSLDAGSKETHTMPHIGSTTDHVKVKQEPTGFRFQTAGDQKVTGSVTALKLHEGNPTDRRASSTSAVAKGLFHTASGNKVDISETALQQVKNKIADVYQAGFQNTRKKDNTYYTSEGAEEPILQPKTAVGTPSTTQCTGPDSSFLASEYTDALLADGDFEDQETDPGVNNFQFRMSTPLDGDRAAKRILFGTQPNLGLLQ